MEKKIRERKMINIDECPVKQGDIIWGNRDKRVVLDTFRSDNNSMEWQCTFAVTKNRWKQKEKYLKGLYLRNIAEWGHTKIRMNARAVGWK